MGKPTEDQIAEQIFKIIKGFNYNIVIFTDDGKKTVNPSEARRFYIKNLQIMVNYDTNQVPNRLVLNLSKNVEVKDIKPLLDLLRDLSKKYLIDYTVKTFGKIITPKDFSFQAKSNIKEDITVTITPDSSRKARVISYDGNRVVLEDIDSSNKFTIYLIDDEFSYIMNQIRESGMSDSEKAELNEGFSGWYGSARKSINELDSAKLVVRHTHTVDETKRGSRTRRIKSIFIENCDGERFKFPFKNVTAAKAMLRHVASGGNPYDDLGKHILNVAKEINHLKEFYRQNRKKNIFEDENINEEIKNHVNSLRKSLKRMTTKTGYKEAVEKIGCKHDDDDDTVMKLIDSDVLNSFDEEISESLPYVARVIENYRGRQEKEKAILQFAKYVMDHNGTFEFNHLIDKYDPDSPVYQKLTDPATRFSAWVSFIAPKLKDDTLANYMMNVSNYIHSVGDKYFNIAKAALDLIIKKNGLA